MDAMGTEAMGIAWIVVALLVGALIGWGFFRWRHGDALSRHAAIVAERDAVIEGLKADLEAREGRLENVQSNLDTFRDSLGRIDGTVDLLKSRLGEALDVIETIEEPPGLLADGTDPKTRTERPIASDDPDAAPPRPEQNPREDRP